MRSAKTALYKNFEANKCQIQSKMIHFLLECDGDVDIDIDDDVDGGDGSGES